MRKDSLTMNLRISNMTGKLKGLHAINTNTLTNEFCIQMSSSGKEKIICTKCYSVEMLNGLRKSCVPSWQANSDILSNGLIPKHMLPTILDAYFRISGHGELINLIMMENLHNIINHNPHCTFAMWTKRKNLVYKFYANHEKPSNLILIYSNPTIDKVMTKPPRLFDRTFNNVSKDSEVDQNCTGQKCKDCLLCYKHVKVQPITQIVEAVK